MCAAKARFRDANSNTERKRASVSQACGGPSVNKSVRQAKSDANRSLKMRGANYPICGNIVITSSWHHANRCGCTRVAAQSKKGFIYRSKPSTAATHRTAPSPVWRHSVVDECWRHEARTPEKRKNRTYTQIREISTDATESASPRCALNGRRCQTGALRRMAVCRFPRV